MKKTTTVAASKSKERVGDAWVQHFVRNGSVKKKDRLTDGQIQDAMRKQFPLRTPKVFIDDMGVHTMRLHYNRGGFNRGYPPSTQSRQYDGAGDRISPIPTLPESVKAIVGATVEVKSAKKKSMGKKSVKKISDKKGRHTFQVRTRK